MFSSVYLVGCLVVAICHTSEAGFLEQIEKHRRDNGGFFIPSRFSVLPPTNKKAVEEAVKYLVGKSKSKLWRSTTTQEFKEVYKRDVDQVCREIRLKVCENVPLFQSYMDQHRVHQESEGFNIVDEDGNFMGTVATPIHQCVVAIQKESLKEFDPNKDLHLFHLYIAETSKKMKRITTMKRIRNFIPVPSQHDAYKTEYFYLFLEADQVVTRSIYLVKEREISETAKNDYPNFVLVDSVRFVLDESKPSSRTESGITHTEYPRVMQYHDDPKEIFPSFEVQSLKPGDVINQNEHPK